MEKDRWMKPYAVTLDVELVHELDEEAVEAELSQNFLHCKKNPGHQEFMPLNAFSLQHLPQECRSQEMLEVVRAYGEMTVKLRVSHTSASRPDTFPETKQGSLIAYYQPGGAYPYKDYAGSACRRVGSGFVIIVDRGGEWQEDKEYSRFRYKLTGPCQCSRNCVAKSWARFHVITALHLVYNQEEADHVEVEFFFNTDQDQTEGRTRKINGSQVLLSSLEGDRCNLFLYTHDMSLIKRQEAALRRVEHTRRVKLRHKNSQEQKIYPVFVLGHPHGCGKVVTIGQVTDHRMDTDTDETFDPVTTFTAPTCPGSSGGPVIWFRYDNEDEEERLTGSPRPHSCSLKTGSVAGKTLGRCGQLIL